MIDWENFKKTKFAIKCETQKEGFFAECKEHGIYNFNGERANERDIFVCRLCYKDQFSDGRYELLSVDEWQTKPHMLFDAQGIEIIDYENMPKGGGQPTTHNKEGKKENESS